MQIIFDSNVFDEILSGNIDLDYFLNQTIEIFITHIQIDELNNCSDVERRAILFNILSEIRPIKIPTESFVVGTSRIGGAKISDGNILEKLRLQNMNHTNDALIGETAIKNNLTLITNDKKLRNKMKNIGGSTLSFDELLSQIQK